MSGFKRYPPEDFFSGQQLSLAQAVHDGDLSRVRDLAPKTDLATPGNKNTTLLSFAMQEAVPVKQDANNTRFQIISELVKDGAKPEQTFGQNGNIAFMSARADTPNFLKALLAGGMSADMRYDGDTPLIFATTQDNLLPQLRVLVEHKANVNQRDSLGETALFGATRLRQWEAVDYLLAHGADPTIVNENGLQYAKTLYNELKVTPKDSPQLERIDAVAKRIVAAGGQWPPA
ncbi:ankyrin repeat domain-containing protein [Paraburkholderia phenazinium]|uniref:Ankyrin repeat-containing protein n=1 Tax=Paraburkholderia phenazinium TaxID=60549 RepID=A0A1G7VQM9_9BURK|nr:ankyrin repeat domain-containing protein [Paraburkholderia phenazinium]SDG62126.1 Ankyrin repeat-containing protein [Paraburkholderia phenazinium]